MITGKATANPYTVKVHIAGDHQLAVENICKNYCTKVGLCVTVTPTNYIYKNGSESGFTIGLINYPRFPESPDQIFRHAEKLAFDLAVVLDQMSYTIETPDQMHYYYDAEKKPMPIKL